MICDQCGNQILRPCGPVCPVCLTTGRNVGNVQELLLKAEAGALDAAMAAMCSGQPRARTAQEIVKGYTAPGMFAAITVPGEIGEDDAEPDYEPYHAGDDENLTNEQINRETK